MSDHARARALCFLLAGAAWAAVRAGEAETARRILVCPHAWTTSHASPIPGEATDAAVAVVARHVAACQADTELAGLLPGLAVLRPYLDSHPEERDALLRLLRAGRLEASGSLGEGAGSFAGGEAFIRSVVLARLYHQRVLGVPSGAYVVAEKVGSSPQLSQILLKTGHKACFWTGRGSGASSVFWHLSPNGGRLLHCRAAQWQMPESLDDLRRMVTGSLAVQEALGLPADFHLVAPGPKGPLPFPKERMAELRGSGPPVVLGGPNAYLATVLPRAAGAGSRVPTVSHPFRSEAAGAAVSRVELKVANRLCESAVLDAERFATVAWLLGAEYPERVLDKAWRLLLAAQRNGGVAGTGGQAVYLETLLAQREALELSRGSLRGALRYIGRAIHTASRPGVPVVVFNPLSWARADVCRATLDLRGLRTRGLGLLDDQAKPVAFEVLRITKSPTGLLEEAQILFVAADVPSVGFRLYHVVASTSLQPPAVTEEAPAGTIDNEFFRITCDASFGGGIVRLLDKRSKREVLRREGGRTGNELVLLRESPERQGGAGELWTSGPMALSSRQPTRLEVRSGPVAMSITATGQVGGRCHRRQVVTIYRGVPRIDCTTELTYSGRDDLFAVTFPVGQPGAVPIVDGRFCVRTVRRGRQALDYRTTATAAPSGCQVHAAGQWASFGSSVRVAFADREARVLASFHLGPSAIVHTSDAAGRNAAVFLQRILAPRGIQCSAVSDKDDVSEIASPFRIVLAIAETNAHAQRLLASLDEPAREALAGRRKSQGYALAVLRDVAGRPGSRPATTLLILAPAAEQMTKALQDIASSIETTTAITVPVTANHAGIRTTAPDAGLAVLNQGTVAHSFEPDGRLALFLMHTAAWPSEAIERPLLPEQGLRVFRYALYPHGADWREAVVHRAAAAFNHPLLVLTPDRHDGPLASPTSFVSVEPENAVLCALKPSGYPLVAPATREAAAERRGVVLRLYEAYGEGPCDAHVRLFAPIQKAWRTNLLEERDQAIDVAGQDVAVKLGAAAIQTLEVAFGEGLPHLAAAKLDTVAEPVQPTPSRYWRAGLAAPLGNQPVAVSVTGQPQIGQTADVRVALANHTDTRLTGTVWLVSPKLWDVTPRQFDYRIGPRSHTVRTVRVSVPTGTRGGQLAALTQHDGQTYRDAVVAGTYRPLTLTVERTATRIRARIRNPNPFLVSGRAEAICGPEAWPRHVVGHYSRWAVTPRVQAFAVAPESEAVVSFRIEPGAPRAWHEGFWCAIKLAYDGRVVYAAEPP